MILTMFILAGILIVAMSGAYIVLVGITSSGFQAQSTNHILRRKRERNLFYGICEKMVMITGQKRALFR